MLAAGIREGARSIRRTLPGNRSGRLKLIANDEAISSGIGATLKNAIANLDHHGTGNIAPRTGNRHDVPHGGEFVGSLLGNARLKIDFAWGKDVHTEGTVKRFGLETRRLHRLLRRHVKYQDVQNYLQQRLVLVVCARSRDRK